MIHKEMINGKWKLEMDQPKQIGSCVIWRVRSPHWNEASEMAGMICAGRLAGLNRRGLVIPFHSLNLSVQDANRWALVRYDFEQQPTHFFDRIALHVRQHPNFPFAWISRWSHTQKDEIDVQQDEQVIEAIARSGHFDWIWVHEQKEVQPYRTRNDRTLLESTVSMAM